MRTIVYTLIPGEPSRLEGVELRDLTPKELMLAALGKCTLLTAVALLAKMRVTVSHIRVETGGGITGDEAKATSVIDSFAQRVELSCPVERDRPAAERALRMTHEKYCGVGLMMEKIAPLEFTFEITG